MFLRKSSDALDLLTEAKLERRFRPPGGDLSNLYAAYYVAELLSELTDDYDPHPELFDAADADAGRAAHVASDVAPVVLRFELTALRVLGHLPSLETCVECGTVVNEPGRRAFSQLAGGVLCKSCRVGQKQVISVSRRRAGDAWRGWPSPTARSGGSVELDRRSYGELRAVLNHYWSHLLGHEPRMHRYLGTAIAT